jgi:hypothetical protein
MNKNSKSIKEHLYPWEKILIDKPLNLNGWDEFEKKSLENWQLPKDF